MVKVLSVGGSIISPEKPDIQFLSSFASMIKCWLEEDNSRKIILVAGGGTPARIYQQAYYETAAKNGFETSSDAADWIGIIATRLNAQLLKAVFGSLCTEDVIYDPSVKIEFKGRVLVASGWKPGFSTDNDAVVLAEQYGADTVVNLSNIEKVYTSDPKKNPNAEPIDKISWKDFRNMVGDTWTPGKNTPFDPIASKKAEECAFKVICASGKNIENIKNILDGKDFTGTQIG